MLNCPGCWLSPRRLSLLSPQASWEENFWFCNNFLGICKANAKAMRGGLGVLSGSKIGFLAKFWLGLIVSICLHMQTPAPFLALLHLPLSPGKLIPIDNIIQDSLNLGFCLDLASGRHHQGTSGREKSGLGTHPLHCPHPRAACFWQWQCFSKMPAPCHVDPLLCLSFLFPQLHYSIPLLL